MPTKPVPPRIFDAQHMADGVELIRELNAQRHRVAPQATGPMAHVPVESPQEPPPEIREGHCLKCKGKKSFQVEGSQKVKSGAIRKYGRCLEPGCNTMISTFVAGAEEGTQ